MPDSILRIHVIPMSAKNACIVTTETRKNGSRCYLRDFLSRSMAEPMA